MTIHIETSALVAATTMGRPTVRNAVDGPIVAVPRKAEGRCGETSWRQKLCPVQRFLQPVEAGAAGPDRPETAI